MRYFCPAPFGFRFMCVLSFQQLLHQSGDGVIVDLFRTDIDGVTDTGIMTQLNAEHACMYPLVGEMVDDCRGCVRQDSAR